MMNISGLILTWMASSTQSTYYARKTLSILHKYIDFETPSTPICSGNASFESNYLFQFENALSGKILGYSSQLNYPSWDDVRMQVKSFISPMCELLTSKFYYKENEFHVCCRPTRWTNFSRFDVNIIRILPGAMLSDEEATGYLKQLIKENNSELVKRMLSDAPSLITKNTDLLYVIINDSQFNEKKDEALDTIQVLIEQKCDVNQRNFTVSAQEWGNPIPLRPIQIVSSRHNYRTLNLLIESKAKVNFKPDLYAGIQVESYIWPEVHYRKNQCPLRLAISNNAWFDRHICGNKKFETVKALIHAKCYLNNLNNFSEANTPILEFALQKINRYTDDHKVIQLLIKSKADVNHCNTNGDTPLHYAVLLNEPTPHCILYLLQAKANINKKNSRNETPFWSLVKNELTRYQSSCIMASIRCLIDHKCDVNRIDKYAVGGSWYFDEVSPISKYFLQNCYDNTNCYRHHQQLIETLLAAKCVI